MVDNFDLIKSCMDVIEKENLNKELNSITYYYRIRWISSIFNNHFISFKY